MSVLTAALLLGSVVVPSQDVQAAVGKKKYNCTVKVSASKKQTTGAGNPPAAKAPVSTTVPSGSKPVTADPTATAVPVPTTSSDNTSQLRTVIYDGTNRDEILHMGEIIAVVIKDGLTNITWKGTTYTSVDDFEIAFGGFD